MEPLQVYRVYLATKNHFTKPNYDYQKYCGKVNASLQSFYKRKDRMWFEKLSRQKTDQEIVDFFVANFVSCANPQSLWVGEIIKNGENNYNDWSKKIQSLSYIFKEEVNFLFSDRDFDDVFRIKGNSHPEILKQYLQEKVSLETMVLLNQILNYKKEFDLKLLDPIWEFVSMRIQKYSSFLHMDIIKYKKILRECVL